MNSILGRREQLAQQYYGSTYYFGGAVPHPPTGLASNSLPSASYFSEGQASGSHFSEGVNATTSHFSKFFSNGNEYLQCILL